MDRPARSTEITQEGCAVERRGQNGSVPARGYSSWLTLIIIVELRHYESTLSRILLVRNVFQELTAVWHVIYSFEALLWVKTFPIDIIAFENVWKLRIRTCTDVRIVEISKIEIKRALCI